MKRIVILLLLVRAATSQEATITWLHAQQPVYPQMARIAHIQGPVTVVLEVQPDGSMTIQHVVGPPILVAAAREAIQQAVLRCNGCGQEPHTFVVVYNFKIADPPPPPLPEPLPPKTAHLARSMRCVYLWKCRTVWR